MPNRPPFDGEPPFDGGHHIDTEAIMEGSSPFSGYPPFPDTAPPSALPNGTPVLRAGAVPYLNLVISDMRAAPPEEAPLPVQPAVQEPAPPAEVDFSAVATEYAAYAAALKESYGQAAELILGQIGKIFKAMEGKYGLTFKADSVQFDPNLTLDTGIPAKPPQISGQILFNGKIVGGISAHRASNIGIGFHRTLHVHDEKDKGWFVQLRGAGTEPASPEVLVDLNKLEGRRWLTAVCIMVAEKNLWAEAKQPERPTYPNPRMRTALYALPFLEPVIGLAGLVL